MRVHTRAVRVTKSLGRNDHWQHAPRDCEIARRTREPNLAGVSVSPGYADALRSSAAIVGGCAAMTCDCAADARSDAAMSCDCAANARSDTAILTEVADLRYAGEAA